MSYSEKLAQLVKNSGKSLRYISEKCKENGYKVDSSYISKLQSGKLPPPSEEVSHILAVVCGGDPKELIYAGYLERSPDPIKNYMATLTSFIKESVKAIVLAQMPMDLKRFAEDQINSIADYQLVDEITKNKFDPSILTNNTYMIQGSEQDVKVLFNPLLGLEMNDDSMEPLIPKGASIQMEGVAVFNNDDLVLVKQGESYFIRRLIKYDNLNLLVAQNKAYPTMSFKEDMKIVGRINSFTMKV